MYDPIINARDTSMDLFIFLNALTALFVIIDPIGTSLIFNALTSGQSARERLPQAFKANMISAALLVLFGNYGAGLLSHLGISINALKISGGFLLFYTAFQMIHSQLTFKVKSKSEDISVYPMSIPLLMAFLKKNLVIFKAKFGVKSPTLSAIFILTLFSFKILLP